MKRGITTILCVAVFGAAVYSTANKWALHHQTMTFFDATRSNRPITIDVAVRRDRQMQADAGMLELPVAVISNGEGVQFSEYSFLTNALAGRGYLAVSIQQDLPIDLPLPMNAGEPFVGRQPAYERGVANILFVVDELKKIQPNADYRHLFIAGQSNGGDISMYFAKQHPDRVKAAVLLDNLHVPLVTEGNFPVLAFISHDPNFKADSGVIPDEQTAEQKNITVVKTSFQHNDMSDRGSEESKSSIQAMLDKYIEDISAPKSGSPGSLDAIIAILAEYVVAYKGIVTAGVGIAITLIGGYLMRSQITRLLISALAKRRQDTRRQRPQRPHIAGYFARQSAVSSFLGGSLILVAFCYSLFLRDATLALVVLAFLLAVALRHSLTAYRAKRGYLGTNAHEALELIIFISKKADNGGLPPDMGPYYAEEPAAIDIPELDALAARGRVR